MPMYVAAADMKSPFAPPLFALFVLWPLTTAASVLPRSGAYDAMATPPERPSPSMAAVMRIFAGLNFISVSSVFRDHSGIPARGRRQMRADKERAPQRAPFTIFLRLPSYLGFTSDRKSVV